MILTEGGVDLLIGVNGTGGRAMLRTTIRDQCYRFKSFVYGRALFLRAEYPESLGEID
jgi:hypothetical protein